MVCITKPIEVGALAALLSSSLITFPNAGQLIFTIQEGQLIFPLATATLASSNSICTCVAPEKEPQFAEFPTVTYSDETKQTSVKVINIQTNGKKCPQGSEVATLLVAENSCSYGNYIGKIHDAAKSEATCCFVEAQAVFLLALPGGEKNLHATYMFDNHNCCADKGEENAKIVEGQCKHQSATLKIPSEDVKKCCWNTMTQDFQFHLEQYQPTIIFPDVSLHENGTEWWGSWDIRAEGAKLFGDRVEVNATLFLSHPSFEQKK